MNKINIVNKIIASNAMDVLPLFVKDRDLKFFEEVYLKTKSYEEKETYLKSKTQFVHLPDREDTPYFEVDNSFTIIYNKSFEFNNGSYNLNKVNNNCLNLYYDFSKITLKYIKFAGKYYLIGTYSIQGACEGELSEDDNTYKFKDLWCYGNPILAIHRGIKEEYTHEDTGLKYNDPQRNAYMNDVVTSSCFICLKVDDTEAITSEQFENILTDDLISRLMSDITGMTC